MRRPIQALFLAADPKEWKSTLRGVKRISLREGHRDYKSGTLVICCPELSLAILVNVIEVKHTTLGEITEEEYKADGFKDKEDLILGMRKFPGYENLSWQSEMTVIRWENARGFLVDHITIAILWMKLVGFLRGAK